MVISHLRHFETLSSAGEGVGGGDGLKKWKYQLFLKISIYPLTFFQFFLGTGVWNRNLQHQFESISCAVCIYFSDKFYSCLFPCPNFCPRFFAVVFLPSMFCPCPFFALKFCPCPCPQNVSKKEGKGKISFLPSDSFPHVFCPQILPLPLPSFFALVFRAKKEGKGKGKIWGQNTWGNESEGKKEGKTRSY